MKILLSLLILLGVVVLGIVAIYGFVYLFFELLSL